MSNKKYKLAFITVNYNGFNDTRDLLDSIATAQLSIDYAVVVVDNASYTDEWEQLQKIFPNILGCRSAENLGFAGGNNLGLDLVDAEYYYFINNDTILPQDANQQILNMLDFLASNPSIGGLSPKIMYVDVPGMIQFAGCTELTDVTLRNYQIGYQEMDKGQYQEITEISYLHGAAMLIKSEVINVIGRLPELYFLYYEELDWCFQIRKKYQLYYYPNSYIHHKESASTGANSPFKMYYLTRNRLIFAKRNRKGVVRLLAIVYIAIASLLHAFLFLTKGMTDTSLAICKGTRDGLQFKRYR